MKRFVFLLAGFAFFSMSGWANDLSLSSWNNTPNQSFIFMENGVEFSVFQDGHFDFYIPNQGPDVSVGFTGANSSFSFNTGYNYNPFVQYDSYGAVIQIQNTPVYYDYFGRVQQVGNIFIDYNPYGRVNRIGGLQLFYRNNIFWRQSGFVNHMNRRYVWSPWHSYYAIPAANYSLISYQPYRQFYIPVRHIYYRPYVDNHRYFDFNREQPYYRSNRHSTRSQSYAQTPRTSSERNLRSNVESRQTEMNATRNSRVSNTRESDARNARAISGRDASTSRNVTSRSNRTTPEVDASSRRTQISSRTNGSTNARSSSLTTRRIEQAKSRSEVSRRNVAQAEPRLNKPTTSRSESSSRSNGNRSSRNR